MEKKTVLRFFHLIALTVVCSMSFVGCGQGNPVVREQSVPQSNEVVDSNLQSVSNLLILDETNAKHYSADLTNLVGQYYQIITVDGRKSIQLLGRAREDMKVDKLELKDKVLFNKVIDKNYRAGVNIPWLNLKANDDERIDTHIQDVATVTVPSSASFIKKYLPTGNVVDPSLPVYYVSGATVTIISQKLYSSKNIDGSIPIISIGGAYVYVKDILSNSWVISVTKILAKNPTRQPERTSEKISLYGLSNSFSVDKLYKEDDTVKGVMSVLPPKKK